MDFLHEYLDVVLVPSGLLIMLFYHLFLLYTYRKYPEYTSMGYEINDKKVWVEKILKGDNEDIVRKNVSRGLGVIASNTSATMYLATISLTLCSLIGTWMANSTDNFFPREIIYGNTSPSIISIKHFVHSNYLLSTTDLSDLEKQDREKKVENAVQRGSEFWSLGLRALYFALNFLLWFFGPIPMFVSSMIMVLILCCHDLRSDTKKDLKSKSNNQKDG
ncbi:uncharacterized protein Pyn_30419 [Prunus yedoensis var. nudiflora]|uniref:DUF599 domain-containing protein n=1 Tax=Prunus yedoensis var. nudiflora TaxID=2094558 RepID=A0A314ZR11_PRUYE|nr:uncharacterized protein Pyn_30419 [Prunus yedoensis var. nudiflora]